MTSTKTFLRLPPALLAASLALTACSAPGDGASNPLTLDLEADTRQGEAPLVVNFTATTEPPRDDLSYHWNFGVGGTSFGSQSRAHVFTEPGRYTVSVSVVGGGLGARDELTLEVAEASGPRDISNRPPTASLAADATDPAAPYEVTFLVTADDENSADALSYSLDFGDGTRTAQNSATHTYRAPGFYRPTVVVSDGRGGVAIAETELTLE